MAEKTCLICGEKFDVSVEAHLEEHAEKMPCDPCQDDKSLDILCAHLIKHKEAVTALYNG